MHIHRPVIAPPAFSEAMTKLDDDPLTLFEYYEITGARSNISSIFVICSLLNRSNSIA